MKATGWICVLVLLIVCVHRATAQQALMNFAMGMLQNYFSSQLSMAGLLLQLLTAGASTAFGMIGKRDLTSPSGTPASRHTEDVYFNAIHALDDRDCIASLLCNVARVPNRFKSFGSDVYAYFKKHGFDGSSASATHYKKAFERGLSGHNCSVPQCEVNTVLLGVLLGGLKS